MKYVYVLLIMIAGVTSSCIGEVSTGDVSRQTDFPVITVNGDNPMFLLQGTPYVEEGAEAEAGGESIDVAISYGDGLNFGSPGVDTDVPDLYVVSYSAVNEDGFAGSALKEVYVLPPTGDLVNSIEGVYTSDVQRAPNFTPGPPYEALEYVFISKNEDGTYNLSHAIGGYYDMGRGYGSGYAAKGAVITANSIPGNDFTVTQAVFPVWGNTADVTELTVNPETKSITWTGLGNFGNGTFKVQLTQVQL